MHEFFVLAAQNRLVSIADFLFVAQAFDDLYDFLRFVEFVNCFDEINFARVFLPRNRPAGGS